MSGSLQSFTERVQHCDVCLALEFSARASHVCIQCQKLLCGGCMRKHDTDQLFTGHTILAIKDVEGVTLHCKSHPQENVQMYCVTCGQAICVVCVLSVHDDHQKESFQEYVPHRKDLLNSIVEKATVRHEEALSLRAKIEEKIASCERDSQQAIQEINGHYDMLQRILETKRNLLLSQLQKTTEKRTMQLTQFKDSLEDRILSLMEHTSMATELVSNDIKLIKANKSFLTNFEASFVLENEETEDALSPKKVRFIPSYDINLGIVNCSAPRTFQGYLDYLKDTTSDSSSSGFYDDSACSQLSLEDHVAEEYNRAEKLHSEAMLPFNRASQSQGVPEEIFKTVLKDKNVPFGKVQPNVDPKMPFDFQPKLVVTINFKDVSSEDLKRTETFNTVPVGLAFKNEHKIYVTQWGIARKSRDNVVHEYKQVHVGMVLYSLCSGDTCAEMCFNECNPWDVVVHQGLCYVADGRRNIHTIRKYMDDGTPQGTWPSQMFYQPTGLTVCVDRVMVLDHSKQVRVCLETRPNHPENVLKLGQKETQPVNSGIKSKYFPFKDPKFVTSNNRGWIIVSDTGGDSVHIFTDDGDHMFSIANFNDNDSFRRPMGIITDTNDNMYVSDYCNDRVLRFDPNGIFLEEVLNMQVNGITRPCGLAFHGSLLALSCHDRHNTPAVKIFDMGKVLQPIQQVKCPCRWLRLCQGPEDT